MEIKLPVPQGGFATDVEVAADLTGADEYLGFQVPTSDVLPDLVQIDPVHLRYSRYEEFLA